MYNTDNKSEAANAHTKESAEHLEKKYPTKRGFIGYAAKHVFLFFSCLLINMKCIGRQNFPSKNPYVVASNHQSYPDGVWIAKYLPSGHFRHMCCLAASDLETNHGYLGRLIMKVGRGIAVDRYGNPVRGLIKAKKNVESGDICFVFPEGTRTASGYLGELKDGASYIAIKAGVPLIPVYISGAYQIWPRDSKHPHSFSGFMKRKKLRIYVGEPMLGKDYGGDAHKMTEALTMWMNKMQEEHFIPS